VVVCLRLLPGPGRPRPPLPLAPGPAVAAQGKTAPTFVCSIADGVSREAANDWKTASEVDNWSKTGPRPASAPISSGHSLSTRLNGKTIPRTLEAVQWTKELERRAAEGGKDFSDYIVENYKNKNGTLV
jgi:hypothetical protein